MAPSALDTQEAVALEFAEARVVEHQSLKRLGSNANLFGFSVSAFYFFNQI